MAEEKTVLLKLELDVAQLKKNSEDASTKLTVLKSKQDDLKKSAGTLTPEYAKLKVEIAQQTKILNDNSKAIVINENLTKKNTGSINDERAQLAALTVAYNALTKGERENAEVGGKIQSDIRGLSDSLKEQESAIGDNRRNVGNYTNDLKGLKQEIKDLKGTLVGLDAGSEEYQNAQARAGELADKLKEVNENVKASSGGSGYEKLGNTFSLIKDDLANLDFAGVNEKLTTAANISSKLTFKETLGGLKNLGSGFLNLAKVILTNPLFLIVGAVAAIVVALKIWNDSVHDKAVKAQQDHTKSIENNIKAIQKQKEISSEISDLYIKQAELQGASTKNIGKLQLEALKEQNEAEKIEAIKHIAAIKSLEKERRLSEDADERQALNDKIQEHKEANLDLVIQDSLYGTKVTNLNLEINNKIRDEEKTSQDERKKNAEDALNKRIELERKLSDLLLENTDLSIENEQKKIEAKYKFLTDTAEGNTLQLIEIEKRKNEELNALDEKAKTQELAKIKQNYKEEIQDAEGNTKIIKQLKANESLEKSAIDIDYDAKRQERDSQYNSAKKALDKQLVSDARKTAQDIELIDAEIIALRKKGTKDEFSALSDLQFAKVRIIESNRDLELENALLTAEQRIKITKDAELQIQQLQNQTFDSKKENDEKEVELTRQQKKDLALSAVNSAGQLSDSFFQISQNQSQKEINDTQEKYDKQSDLLQQQLDTNIITQAQFNAQKSALESEFNAQSAKLKEDAFKKNKTSQLINATIATAVGVTSALSAPPPVGLILAGIAGALGLAQVALIASQPTPKFQKGGVFGGRPHSSGGTKGVFEDGTRIEVEKDEKFFILNKNASRTISGLSDLNVRYGGVPLMERGGQVKFDVGGVFSSSITQPINNRFSEQNSLMQAIRLIPPGVIRLDDINRANQRLIKVQERGNF